MVVKSILAVALLLLASSTHAAEVNWRVDWVAPSDNVDGSPLIDLTGFNLYFKTSSSSSYQQSINIPDPLAVSHDLVLNVENGTRIYVVMTAYDSESPPNESIFSNEIVSPQLGEVDALAPAPVQIQGGTIQVTNCPTGLACILTD